MTVNFKRLDEKGFVKVTAFTANGKVVAKSSASGDGTRQHLIWNCPLSVEGPIELQFEIVRGALYSVEAE